MTKAKLFWMDLEMTGLDPVEDRIMEVAVVATDWDFQEIATFEAVQKVDEELMKSRMVGEFWDKYDFVRKELQDQNNLGAEVEEVQGKLVEFLKANFEADQPVILAGNSIHQDRKFIEHEWPLLDSFLHYRMLDVSAWKVVYEGKFKKPFYKTENHRALEDIRGSIEEMKYYLGTVQL